ncbi:MAG: VCBS repeat-containing protein [Saprospiraceae bacterium]|nr:VCBS repeat-containing protein [Saprospiraceae bacterium]
MMRLGVIFLCLLLVCCDGERSTQPVILFETLDATHTGIDFSNSLQENLSTKSNLLDFDYFYNGAGVGAADLDNDGLPELFFSGNQVSNRLYHNQGKLKFTDVTDIAGVNTGHQWSNGITFADVNSDGLTDIYVCQGGPLESKFRKNLLFINEGALRFREAAAAFGLDDQGISTQAAFFDYDLDGDLDCFVMNESELYGYDPAAFYRLHLENPGRWSGSFSHLYRNDDGKFKDVSVEAGIDAPTFGLGLVIGDINEDGWPDIYVANDYYVPDHLYINRKNGAFVERSRVHLKQMSFFGMGADLADMSGDGHQDIVVVDMASKDHVRAKTLMASMDSDQFSMLVDGLGMPHQYMFNTLQLNDGAGRFNNVAHQAGLAKTDWSWAPIVEDFDWDGDADIIVTNGYRRYALDNDFKLRVVAAKQKYNGKVPLAVKEQLYQSMPSETLPNLYFENQNSLQFREKGEAIGLRESTFSNGAISVDLDGDGDLDLALSNIDQEALVYESHTARKGGSFLVVEFESALQDLLPVVRLWSGGKQQVREVRRTRGYMSSTEPKATFGLTTSSLDSLEVVIPGKGKVTQHKPKINGRILIRENEFTDRPSKARRRSKVIRPTTPLAHGLDFNHQENEYDDYQQEVLLPYKQSTLGPSFATADVNGDGMSDLFLTGAAGQSSSLYLQKEDGAYVKSRQPQFEKDFASEDVSAAFFDLEGDGDQDLFVVTGGNAFPEGDPRYQDRLYVNDGGVFRRTEDALQARFSGKCVVAVDLDGDGDSDLVVGNRIQPQGYPVSAPSQIWINEQGTLVNATQKWAPDFEDFGIVNDIAAVDLDQDGRVDLVVVGEWTTIGIFKNDGARLRRVATDFDHLRGMWMSVTVCDMDGDGLQDLAVGNMGLNSKFTATVDAPFQIYAEDFDSTGTLDLVLANPYKGKYVPVRGRECSSEQMPFIADRFPSYDAFANASLEDIYGDGLHTAYHREVNTFESHFLHNKGDMRFEAETLPYQAQTFPMLTGTSADLNGDGLEDLVLAGCIYNMEVETPRLDAGTGLVLLSDGNGFSAGACPDYCLTIPGNIKFIDWLDLADGRKVLLSCRNNETLYTHAIESYNDDLKLE